MTRLARFGSFMADVFAPYRHKLPPGFLWRYWAIVGAVVVLVSAPVAAVIYGLRPMPWIWLRMAIAIVDGYVSGRVGGLIAMRLLRHRLRSSS